MNKKDILKPIEVLNDSIEKRIPNLKQINEALENEFVNHDIEVGIARHYFTDEKEQNNLTNIVGMLAAHNRWQTACRIYDFDTTLFNALVDTPISEELPAHLLSRLPVMCPFINLPQNKYNLIGFYVWVNLSAKKELCFLRVFNNEFKKYHHEIDAISLEEKNINAAIVNIIDYSTLNDELRYETLNKALEIKKKTEELTRLLVSITLYICSDSKRQDIVVRDRRYKIPTVKHPEIINTGFRVGATIRNRYIYEEYLKSNPTERKIIPHIRAAHWHSYWIGPKNEERKLIVHWIPPIPVNEEFGEVEPTIYPIKKNKG